MSERNEEIMRDMWANFHRNERRATRPAGPPVIREDVLEAEYRRLVPSEPAMGAVHVYSPDGKFLTVMDTWTDRYRLGEIQQQGYILWNRNPG